MRVLGRELFYKKLSEMAGAAAVRISEAEQIDTTFPGSVGPRWRIFKGRPSAGNAQGRYTVRGQFGPAPLRSVQRHTGGQRSIGVVEHDHGTGAVGIFKGSDLKLARSAGAAEPHRSRTNLPAELPDIIVLCLKAKIRSILCEHDRGLTEISGVVGAALRTRQQVPADAAADPGVEIANWGS